MRQLRSALGAVGAMCTIVGALALAGCSSDDGGTSTGSSTSGGDKTLVVFAAASLTDTFTTIAHQFEADHAGVTVKLSFAGSSDLVAQLQEGAPADVFASADEPNMKKLTDAGLAAGDPVPFATNVLTIVTPPDNPAGITSFQDLGKSGVKVDVCAPQVPCGNAAKEVEAATGVTIKPVSEESKVTDVLAKVTSGEADAGLVYVTDAKGALAKDAGSLKQIDFPESAKAVNTYPIVAVKDSKNADLASEFVAAVTGEAGQKVLQDAGFGAP
ncbi:molybdate-binding protein [Luteimicrobium album]|uniref:Molybdate-binding protein n=1 Tax=Luteimicrobium album TaxID=1054550 RepID=A0ABQ6I4Y8_9MICO|nr:molybdate ABC transporter substrate-binding protein [Luteimicrobium album]GMA25277.1 molybdate-binding protein [Luteimicrobium album]